MGKLGPGPQYAYEDNIKYKDVSEISYKIAILKRSQTMSYFIN